MMMVLWRMIHLKNSVVSGSEASSGNEMWKTIEKWQVKVLADIDKVKKTTDGKSSAFKKKGRLRKGSGQKTKTQQ